MKLPVKAHHMSYAITSSLTVTQSLIYDADNNLVCTAIGSENGEAIEAALNGRALEIEQFKQQMQDEWQQRYGDMADKED